MAAKVIIVDTAFPVSFYWFVRSCVC